MTVVTLWLRREQCTVASRGDLSWTIRLCGLIYSQKGTMKKQFPSFMDDGKSDLILSLVTAKENAPIDKDLHGILEGDLPPVSFSTQILKSLAEMNYKIITMSTGANDSGRVKEFLWTLQG